MNSASGSALQPTLWRTCRVLANRTRLHILECLVRQQPKTVTAVAEHLDLTLPVTSQNLRALESRGLLVSRRDRRIVEYRLGEMSLNTCAGMLLSALRPTLLREPDSIERIFRLATAFTHPRRIEIFRLLRVKPRSVPDLKTATGLSAWALRRHLRKLEARGFIAIAQESCSRLSQPHSLGRVLCRLAGD